MPNNIPDINSMTETERKEFIEGEILRFDNLFNELQKEDYASMPLKIKYLQEEICATYSIAGTLLNVLNDNAAQAHTCDFKNLTYGPLRRLVEKIFCILYIFDDSIDEAESDKRFDSYLNSVVIQYNKMLKELNDFGYPIVGLPSSPLPEISNAEHWPDLASMLTKVKNVYNNQLKFLYPSYRILCFFAHGNANKSVIEEISGTNNFGMIKIKELIGIIENHYNYLIYQKWPHIANKLGYQVV